MGYNWAQKYTNVEGCVIVPAVLQVLGHTWEDAMSDINRLKPPETVTINGQQVQVWPYQIEYDSKVGNNGAKVSMNSAHLFQKITFSCLVRNATRIFRQMIYFTLKYPSSVFTKRNVVDQQKMFIYDKFQFPDFIYKCIGLLN